MSLQHRWNQKLHWRDIMARSKKEVAPSITVEEALTELSAVDIMDWKKWHTLSIVPVVQEEDDVEAPRESESNLVADLVQYIKTHEEVLACELLADLNADSDSLGQALVQLGVEGYAIHFDKTGRVYFGMAKIYEVLMANQSVTVVNKIGRKQEVLAILQRGKHVTVKAIATELGINDRNVSSQLSYLRADGYKIATDSRGYKFLEA
jgi:biotin operon repressor